MTHKLGLPNDLHTAGNLVATVKYVLKSYSDNVHMVVGIYSTCNAEAEQIKTNYEQKPDGVYRGVLFSATGRIEYLS